MPANGASGTPLWVRSPFARGEQFPFYRRHLHAPAPHRRPGPGGLAGFARRMRWYVDVPLRRQLEAPSLLWLRLGGTRRAA